MSMKKEILRPSIFGLPPFLPIGIVQNERKKKKKNGQRGKRDLSNQDIVWRFPPSQPGKKKKKIKDVWEEKKKLRTFFPHLSQFRSLGKMQKKKKKEDTGYALRSRCTGRGTKIDELCVGEIFFPLQSREERGEKNRTSWITKTRTLPVQQGSRRRNYEVRDEKEFFFPRVDEK